MKRLLITLTAAMLVAGSLWAKDDEVIVIRQLTSGQRNVLPEKTIMVEVKGLTFNKKADAGLIEAIGLVMDTIAQEDYLNHTFALLLETQANGEVTIAAQNDDIVTRGIKDATIYYGTLEHNRYHFVVLTTKDNQTLLERTFKRKGKVKFIQEFEFVNFKTPSYPTSVAGSWSSAKGFEWLSVIINEDPNTNTK